MDSFNANKWNDAFAAEFRTCEARFERHTIETKPLLDLLDPNKTSIDLSFLRCLTTTSDTFIPSGIILIRQCMRDVFQRFHNFDENMHVVLIGSPGVGKSLLSFLAALHLAQTQQKTVFFLRMTKEDLVSIFVMRAAPLVRAASPKVHVVFTRTFAQASLVKGHNLTTLCSFLQADILEIELTKELITFIDGPKHDENEHLLANGYNFFCTSAGHPHFKQHQLNFFRRWILDGWSEEDATKLFQVLKYGSRKAKKVYDLCGGSIRLMLRAASDFEHVKDEFDDLIGSATGQYTTTKIDNTHFVTTNRSPETFKLPDRLITMFQQGETRLEWSMKAVQYIDSRYVLTCLGKCVDIGAYMRGYEFSVRINHQAMQGHFYERLIHAGLEAQANDHEIVRKVHWATGTGLDGVTQFTEEKVYWIPSTSNFANIDAWLVHNRTLHVFQYTVKDNHTFYKDTFERAFLARVVVQFPSILAVIVHFVTPSEQWKGPIGQEVFTCTPVRDPGEGIDPDEYIDPDEGIDPDEDIDPGEVRDPGEDIDPDKDSDPGEDAATERRIDGLYVFNRLVLHGQNLPTEFTTTFCATMFLES